MAAIVNISAYKFTPLEDLAELREQLLSAANASHLKGTILLSREGINLFLAGTREEINDFLTILRAVQGLADLAPKESPGDTHPFERMRVKIKREIIAFGIEGVDPARRPSRKLAPETLKRWLDEGRAVTLLDTRNDYEVKLGTFRGAIPAGIDRFRDFPAAVARLPAEIKTQPVVAFCTGGIRCEKAGPFLEREGWTEVFQLDGGILKYFEQCGGAHFEGECFVFDQRVGLDPTLHETGAILCGHCQFPLTVAEQRDSRHVPGQSCPHCFGADRAVTARLTG